MDARASALALPTCGIAETDLAQTASAGVDVARFWIVEQFKLQSSPTILPDRVLLSAS